MFLNFHVFILFVLVCIFYCVLMFLCYLLYVTQCFQDIIPYVDHGVQQKDSHQSEAISEHVKDQVEPGNVAFVGAASGTGSEVPVDAPKKHEVKKSRAKKKKVNVDPSDQDFVVHVESGTSSKVPVEKEAQPSIRETRGRKKKCLYMFTLLFFVNVCECCFSFLFLTFFFLFFFRLQRVILIFPILRYVVQDVMVLNLLHRKALVLR
ncbi:uncharacterized protein LOC115695835 isoform X1 [Cannabis sativa]|uniref:uncharacterized protein LOC115695835 isoform X1 n=1 Tax=Cannabis sativa TaxID=3483 RepID=UPI0029CA630D|nr:uncharacterized protein LOC115695835 isoform X1 [Cannabis sativa]